MSLAVDGLDLVLRSMPGVTVGTLDADMRLVDAAGNWLRRTGLLLADLTGRSLADVAGPELAARCAPGITAALSGTTTQLRVRNPLRVVDPGAPEWIEITIAPASPTPAGEPRVFWLLRDVTGEHDLGNALTAAEQRLDLVGEGAREYAMFALDLDGVVTTWSAAAERLLGHEAAAVVGQHLTMLFPSASAERGVVHGLLRQTAAQGSFRDETWLVDAHERTLRCQISLRALRDRQGDHVGYACIVRDLTEERRARETIALREQMYSAAFDDAPSAMALVEHHVGGWWRVVQANAALASLVGHPVSALVGGGVTLLGDRGDGVVRDVFDAASTAPGGRVELALVRSDGTRRNIVVGLSPLVVPGGDGESRRYVAQLHDVTARREAERAIADALASERRAGAELRELQRQRADFLATVSHELRTPLSSVLGYVELFTDGDLGELTATQRGALATIARNAHRLRDLVGDLLVMSSIERGSLLAGGRPVRVGDVLDVVVDRVRLDAATKGIELAIGAPGDAAVAVDPALLDKILHALVTNALKFTPRGGHVSVGVDVTGGDVEIEVVDDGVGIAAGDLPHVFDPFFRAAASERLAVSGTGLGLSLVRKVVEMVDGSVSATSEPGVRTRFVVRLPAVAVAAERAVAV